MVFIYIIFNTQSKQVSWKIKNLWLWKTLCDLEPSFSWVLQVQDILGRWKLVAIKAPSNFSKMVNCHFKSRIKNFLYAAYKSKSFSKFTNMQQVHAVMIICKTCPIRFENTKKCYGLQIVWFGTESERHGIVFANYLFSEYNTMSSWLNLSLPPWLYSCCLLSSSLIKIHMFTSPWHCSIISQSYYLTCSVGDKRR